MNTLSVFVCLAITILPTALIVGFVIVLITRLLSAFLSIACLSSHDLPDEIQEQFDQLRSLLTDTGPQNDIPKLSSKLRHMRKDKATQVAELFLNIYLQLKQMCGA